MYGRSTILFPLAILAVLALLTLWIDRSVHTPEAKPPGSTRHDPDYYLHDFVTSKTDALGNVKFMLAAVDMTHYPDDDTTTLTRPRFTQYGVDKPYSQIEGQRGLVSSNGDVVEFMDNVKVVRQATAEKGEMTVLTQYLKVFPNENRAVTDRPVVITQAPKTVIHAVGMIFDKDSQTTVLQSRVRAHYERPPPPVAKTLRPKPAAAKPSSNDSKVTGKPGKMPAPAKTPAKPKASSKTSKADKPTKDSKNMTNSTTRKATTAPSGTRR